MLTRFEFATAQRIVFGSGAAGQAAALAAGMGRRPMVVTGRDVARCRWLLDRLADEGLPATCHAFSGEPSVEEVREGARLAQAVQVDLVIAFGGGSALDGGKAIAALATNGGDPAPFLEGIGQGKALERRPLPCIAIPTTAGTGSEVTRNAVLLSREHGLKVSLRHPWLLPQVALVDPETTLSLPPEVTASTGLDALTQLIEPFMSIRANPLTDAICREGLGRAAPALHRAWADGRDREAREAMALASLFGGLALANAGLGAVHGLAAPLGGLRPVPHGVACAALLPHVLDANLGKLRAGGSSGPGAGRFRELARLLTGAPEAEPEDGVAWVRELVRTLRTPRLSVYGLSLDELPGIAEKAAQASSMQANPVKLEKSELVEILARAL